MNRTVLPDFTTQSDSCAVNILTEGESLLQYTINGLFKQSDQNVQWTTKVMTPASVYSLYKQGPSLLWRTVQYKRNFCFSPRKKQG